MVVLSFYVLVFKNNFVLLAPYVCFHILEDLSLAIFSFIIIFKIKCLKTLHTLLMSSDVQIHVLR